MRGPRGLQGVQGSTGDTGPRGATWYEGAGAPGSGLGLNGDYYYRTDGADVYKKTSGAWAVVGNLMGPQGPSGGGSPGSTWHDGSGAPSGGLGIDGDYYLNDANGDVYAKAMGSWTVVASIKGPAGSTGATGPAGPAVVTTKGDLAGHDGTNPIRIPRGADKSIPYVNVDQIDYRSLSAHMDALFGGTRGSVIQRGSSLWGVVSPAADPFKALFSNGSGADAAFAGSPKVLASVNASSAPYAEVTGIPSSVHHIKVLAELSVGTDGAALYARTYGADGVIDSGASDYQMWGASFATNSTSAIQATGNTSQILLMPPGTGVDSAAAWGALVEMEWANIQRPTFSKCHGRTQYLDTAGATAVSMFFSGIRIEADKITGIRIYPSTGTISGRLTVLGFGD